MDELELVDVELAGMLLRPSEASLYEWLQKCDVGCDTFGRDGDHGVVDESASELVWGVWRGDFE